MERRILTLLTAVMLLAGSIFCFPASAADSFTKDNVQLSLVVVNKGKILYDKTASWHLTITNPTDSDMSADVSAVIKDSAGAAVWNDTQSITVPAKTRQVTGISAELAKYGIYTMNVTLTGTFGSIEKSDGFSCIKKNMASNDFMGTQTHFIWVNRDYPDGNLPLIADSGFGVVRDHIEWYQVDTKAENGIPSNVIDFVDRIHESGRKLILNIGNSNPAYDNGGLPVSAEALAAYKEFCTYVAAKLKGKVYAYEIWNEPDYFAAFTNGISNTGAQYCEVLKTAYEAIGAVDKDALILGGSLTEIGYTSLGRNNAALNYMQAMLDAGAAKYMDAFSFHPYANTGYYFDENVRESRSPESQIALARTTLDSYGASGTPIWITEIGTSSYIDDNSDGNNTDEGYTELEQAINLQRMVMIAKAEPTVMGMSIYNHREKGTNPNDFEQNFGMINGDYTAKPAYVGISFLNDFLIDAEFAEKATDGTLKQYRFKDKYDDSDIFAFWTTGGGTNTLTVTQGEADTAAVSGKNLTYPSTHTAAIYDIYGNPVSGSGITIGAEPIYVKCTAKEVTPKISVQDGHVIVSGKINDKSGFATVVAYKNVLGNREVVYAEQVCAENSHGYTVEFDISGDDLYGICVYDGAVNNSFINNSAYDISVELYNRNEKIESLEKVENGDTVTAVITTADTAGIEDTLSFVGVLYGEGGVLIEAKKSDIQWKADKTGEARAALEIEDIAEVKGFKLMLWDNLLRPIINPITVK